MENVTLHTQKVAILSRLVKESSLTLEEALLLLQEEEIKQTIVTTTPSWTPPPSKQSNPYDFKPYMGKLNPFSGQSTASPGNVVTTGGTGSLSLVSTTFLNTPSTLTAGSNNN
jgi:hypothetical protein